VAIGFEEWASGKFATSLLCRWDVSHECFFRLEDWWRVHAQQLGVWVLGLGLTDFSIYERQEQNESGLNFSMGKGNRVQVLETTSLRIEFSRVHTLRFTNREAWSG
jgi:hypothetical protein